MYIGAPIAIVNAGMATFLGTPIDNKIGINITPMAITEPTPYADEKINAVTSTTNIVAKIGAFRPTLSVCDEMDPAIPDDVGVIGYDDDMFADMISPEITSVSQNPQEIGRTAAANLMQIMNDETTLSKTIRIPSTIQMRESL